MMLVTGVTSGLGKFLHEHYQCQGWKRGQPLPKGHFNTIIHCAHDREWQSANLDMVQHLFSVSCDKFIYLSSVEVHKAHTLDNDLYGSWKLRCEQFIRSSYDNYLIIRAGAMIGKYARENTILRLLRGKKLTVTPDSTFGIIRHESLLPVIKSGVTGTVTVTGDIKPIRDIGEELGLCPEYGEFPYFTPEVKPTHETMAEIRAYHD